MKKITKEQIINMHKIVVEKTGGSLEIRDENLLDSAISNPFQTFGGIELYPTVPNKAAQLCFSLIKNHSFVDGNKRIGILAMLVFLEINGIELDCNNIELIELGLKVADGQKKYEDILNFIINH